MRRWLFGAVFALGCSGSLGDAGDAPDDASSVADTSDDASVSDATSVDAGALDAATPPDPVDSAVPAPTDAGSPPPPPPPVDSGSSTPPTDTGSVTPPPPPPPTKLPSNDDPSRIYVYDYNAENLPDTSWSVCKGHWIDFVTFMAKQPAVPDVITVQQLSGAAQAKLYADTLYAKLGHVYAYEVAVDAPGIETNACSPFKDHQTNAVFYRTTRFSMVAGSKQTWQAKISATTTCGGTLNGKDRSIAVAIKLKDNLPAGFKYVPVASIHFPQVDEGCMTQNIKDAIAKVDALGGGLRIVAGDVNYRDRTGGTFNPWWNAADTAVYRDVVYAMCGGAAACLDDNWTNENTAGTQSRIDFMFAQKNGPARPAVAGVDTVSYAQARAAAGDGCGLDYSGHRAIRAYISY